MAITKRIDFNGIDAYVNTEVPFKSSSDNITFYGEFKTTISNTEQYIISCNNDVDTGFKFYIGVNNKLYVKTFESTLQNTGITIEVNKTYQFCLYCDTKLTLYVNGEKVFYYQYNNDTASSLGTMFTIGAKNSNGVIKGSYFNGRIACIRYGTSRVSLANGILTSKGSKPITFKNEWLLNDGSDSVIADTIGTLTGTLFNGSWVDDNDLVELIDKLSYADNNYLEIHDVIKNTRSLVGGSLDLEFVISNDVLLDHIEEKPFYTLTINGVDTVIELIGESNPYGHPYKHFKVSISNISTGTTSISITDYVVEVPILDSDIDIKYGVFRIYKASKEILKAIAIQRFITGEDGISLKGVDIARYITGLISLPLNVPTLENEKYVYLGGTNIGLTAPEINTNINVFEVFNDVVNGFYGTMLDVNNSNIIAHLPYLDIVDIDSKYINTAIKILYKVDVITGDTTALIYSNEKIIQTKSGNIGTKIPYITTDSSGFYVDDSIKTTVNDYRGLIEVQYKTISNENGIYKTSKYDLISNEYGFFSVDSVELSNITATKTEIEQIKSLLQTGVYK